MSTKDPFVHLMLEDIWSARQSSTVQKYCYAIRKFFSFCCLMDLEVVLPLDLFVVARYLAHLRHSGCAQTAVK
jgi:hypothetical protein